jgi:hypothetical protein
MEWFERMESNYTKNEFFSRNVLVVHPAYRVSLRVAPSRLSYPMENTHDVLVDPLVPKPDRISYEEKDGLLFP